MNCPYCQTVVHIDWDSNDYVINELKGENCGFQLQWGNCPACNNLVVKLCEVNIIRHKDSYLPDSYSLDEISYKIIFPQSPIRKMEPEVPIEIIKDYQEAYMVLPFSPKASAALSRRILQNVLQERFNIKKAT